MRTLLARAALGVSVTFSFGACAREERIQPETRLITVDHAVRVPPGVVRYCWEEPIVQFEPNGPGLDIESHWYHPSYVAVREVRQGRWRPCRPVPSEVTGDLKNER